MNDGRDRRMSEILQRAKKIRHSEENYLISGIFCACVSILGGLFFTIVSVTKAMPQSDIIIDTYGTVLLRSGASVYVLVGMLAFVAGVVVTAICIRARQRNDRFTRKKIIRRQRNEKTIFSNVTHHVHGVDHDANSGVCTGKSDDRHN